MMRLACQTITLHPLRAEHFSFLADLIKTLTGNLDVEVVSLSRTRVLHEAQLYVSGKDVADFVSRLQDCFLDAEVRLEPVEGPPVARASGAAQVAGLKAPLKGA